MYLDECEYFEFMIWEFALNYKKIMNVLMALMVINYVYVAAAGDTIISLCLFIAVFIGSTRDMFISDKNRLQLVSDGMGSKYEISGNFYVILFMSYNIDNHNKMYPYFIHSYLNIL